MRPGHQVSWTGWCYCIRGSTATPAEILLSSEAIGSMIDLGDAAEAILDVGSPVVEAAYRRWGCAGAILATLVPLIGIGLLIWWIVR